MNQAGSKGVPTLEFQGIEQCVLKGNCARARYRLTLLTYCSNNRDHIDRCLPAETCFKVAVSDTAATTALGCNSIGIYDPDEVDRRKAIGRVNRFIGCGTGPFRFCTFAFSPSSQVLESYKWV